MVPEEYVVSDGMTASRGTANKLPVTASLTSVSDEMKILVAMVPAADGEVGWEMECLTAVMHREKIPLL